jgi:uncharacterized lipoprotein YddW (UPF0748 family)
MKNIIYAAVMLAFLVSCKKDDDTQNANIFLNAVTLPDHFISGTIKGDSVLIRLPFGTNLKSIKINFVLSSEQTLSEPNNVMFDISSPREIFINERGSKRRFIVRAVLPASAPVAVQGVWVSNVGSNALSSADNIQQTVNTIDELGFNSAFVVVYNKTKTLHKSTVLKQVLGAATEDENMIYPGFDGLKVFIEKAKAKGIKVIAWFEYGFASHYAGMPNPLLVAKPQWASLDLSGNNSMKNNFYWLNGFHPDVQKYMIDFITEVVTKYDIDGVQGDDRLPAMPVNSGYDTYTKQLYTQETGKIAPGSDNDADWMTWRAGKLNDFGKKLYDAVKAIKPKCVVSWSPSTSGWSYTNYLQQWDKWLERGFVDIISPQLYRNESQGLSAYTGLIDKELNEVINKGTNYKSKYFPAILIKSGTYQAGDNYLANCILYNRSKGISGEVMFYFDGIEANRKVFKAFYPVKAVFPSS